MGNKSNKNAQVSYEYDKVQKSVKDILDDWNVNGTLELESLIKEYWGSTAPGTDGLKDIINQIVLWKINRQVFFDQDKTLLFDIITLKNKEGFDRHTIHKQYKDDVTDIIVRMLACPGIRLPMASTILHFFYPGVFLIIDQRAYRVIKKDELNKVIKQNTKPMACAEIYLEYMKACNEYYDDNSLKDDFDFSMLDRYTYHLDIEVGNKVYYKNNNAQ